MKPCGIRIWTTDLEASRLFYTETLSFTLKIDGARDGWIIIGTPTIDLIVEIGGKEEASRYVGLSFRVDDIHAVYDDLREREVYFVSPPAQQPWGGWLADFKDCSGNTLTLVQNPADDSGSAELTTVL